MRVAAMTYPALGPNAARVASIRFRDEEGFERFDAVLWDPNWIGDEYANDIAADGVLSVAASQLFLADLRRRREQLRQYLLTGGVLILVPPGPGSVRVHTLETILSVPVRQAVPVDVTAVPGRPQRLHAIGGEPFRSFFMAMAPELDVGWRLERFAGVELLTDDGGDTYAGYSAHSCGHVVLCPAPAAGAAARFIAAAERLVAALTLDRAEAPPRWIADYVAADERPVRQARDRLRQRQAELAAQIDQLDRRLVPFDRRKRLFTASGRGLVEAVADAFAALGCRVMQGPFSDTDLVIEFEGGSALLNPVASDGPVPLSAIEQLREWREKYTGEHRAGLPAVLVVNPFRREPPEGRPELDPDFCRAAAASGVVIVTGMQLFEMLPTLTDDPAAGPRIIRSLIPPSLKRGADQDAT